MQSHCARAPALALLIFALVCGCGDDGGGSDGSDGDGEPADAGPDGAPGPDVESLCPGELTFEALVADAVTGEPAFEVEVAEVGGANSTTSAPNGRAVLCLPAGADALVRSTEAAHLARLDSVSADALAVANAAVQPYPLGVLTESGADELLADLDPPLTRDEKATQVLVSVVLYPDGEPLAGAVVSIDPAGAGAAAIAGGLATVFANVPLTGGAEDGRAAITVTPPVQFRGSCVGPASVELEAGGLSGALFACQ
jgi:hypothetical protein